MSLFQRILLPTDFSEPSLAAANYAIELANRFGARVDILHVIEEPSLTIPLLETYGAPSREEYEAQAQAMLSEWPVLSDELKEKLHIERRFAHGSAYLEILQDAKEHDCDLIVMGTHGRGLTAHLLLGNVAERVVRKASCPVLTIRPTGHQFVHPQQGSAS